MAAKDNKKPKKSARANNKNDKQDPEAKAPVEPTNRPQELTVVGIGASAGGLAALRSFFGALPPDTGMAFVVVTHLHPEHESHMAELIGQYTSMPTMQVTKKTQVRANHVYVIPPNRSIMMADSHLNTAEFDEPHGRRTPIDHFFRSLAQGHSESIAVILSGGGTDGAVGVKDIKERGGLILVQDPEDAEYDSMPRAAMETGLADVVLPAPALAQKLVEYLQHSPQLPHDPGKLSEQEADTLQRILAQIHARTGHDFNQYKRSTVLRRVERRMQLNGFMTLQSYLQHIQFNPNEARAMFNDILIGVTNFFRDRESWTALQNKVIPVLFDKKRQSDEIRVWSIGCATGEEAYGLAILLLEHAGKLDFRPSIHIFATDLDERAIFQAREGLYPSAIEADVSSERLERFFTREGEYYRINREVRDTVLFANHNALRDPPFSRQDLIACRNVLIYLDRIVQDRVFDIFHYALHPDGYLFLGSSESAEHLPERFDVVDKQHRLYRARRWDGEKLHLPYVQVASRPGSRTGRNYPSYSQEALYPDEPHVVEEKHRRALESYGPPSVLINDKNKILHVSESAGRFLFQPKGGVTGDLLKLVRQELQVELRTAIFHAFEKGRMAVSRPISVQFNGAPHRVIVSVRPNVSYAGTEEEEKQALVLFLEDELDVGVADTEPSQDRDVRSRDQVVAHLEAEVQRLREQLQITIEEYDSSNEEMKASNEELQSLNEEYRSATEELETSKEELQSVNEELQTVNIDLSIKLDEISRANAELENLLGATEIGILYLDREFRIQRFTAGMKELFNTIPSDRGRPIRHLSHNLKYERITEDAEEVLRRLVPLEREVQANNGIWYLIRLRPYRTTDDKIQGVVLSFVNIDKLKAAEQEVLNSRAQLEKRVEERTYELDQLNKRLTQARDLFESFFDTNPVPTSITRLEDGTFIKINDAYLKYFNLREKDVIGHTSRELDLPLDPTLRPNLIARLKKEGPVRNVELETKRGSAEPRTILASMQKVTVDDTAGLMLAFIDVTDFVRMERSMRNAAASLSVAEQADRQRISQILHDDLQQNIFAVKVQLSFLADALAKNDPQSAKVDLKQLDEWLAQSIAITRQLSIDLSPPILSGEGLHEQFLWLAAQMKTQYNLDITVNADTVRATFAEDVRTVVFQSVRELLFNVVKHSGVLQAAIHLEHSNGHVNITVSDDGKGFDPAIVDHQMSHGLKKMRDRLLLVGCAFKIESQPNKGTRIKIEAPTTDSVP